MKDHSVPARPIKNIGTETRGCFSFKRLVIRDIPRCPHDAVRSDGLPERPDPNPVR